MRARHFSPDGAGADVLPGRWAVRVGRRPTTSPATGLVRRPVAGLVAAVLLAAPAMLPTPAPVSPPPISALSIPAPPAPVRWAAGVFGAAPPTGPTALRPAVSRPAVSRPVGPPRVVPARVAPPETASVGARLRLGAAGPARGEGTFDVAAGTGRVLGRAGALRRFRVAVERGSGEDVAAFTATVEATLGDARGWVGGGALRLQRVGPGAPFNFTVYLATRETAARMCLRGGVDIRVDGLPYTSCRAPGSAIVNLDRWRTSAPTFTAARVPLTTYRTYVINHEVGHELGRSHQGCPRRGAQAPVMVQQTLTLRGCTPYPWPRLGGRLLSGPAL